MKALLWIIGALALIIIVVLLVRGMSNPANDTSSAAVDTSVSAPVDAGATTTVPEPQYFGS